MLIYNEQDSKRKTPLGKVFGNQLTVYFKSRPVTL